VVEVKLGPLSSNLIEPIEIQMRIVKKEIVDVKINADYAKRNIEKLALGRNMFNTLYLIERVCGICSHAHTTPYCQAAERILNVTISENAQLMRVILAELERIQSHLLNLFEITHILRLKNQSMKILKTREKILNMLEIIAGNRVHFGVNTIGGVRYFINSEIKQKIQKLIENVRPEIKKFWEIEANIKPKEGIGILSREKAVKTAVGPTARASGVDFDVRRDSPYAAYDEVGLDVKLRTEGDVASRVCVRLEETLESTNIIQRALDLLTGHKEKFPELPDLISGKAISIVEAPRGANEYYIRLNEAGDIDGLKIKTPTSHNIRVLRDILLNQKVEDSEIILTSIDPCISCACRYIYVK
jgi:Ni,Fe-hydrogenase III large subunit